MTTRVTTRYLTASTATVSTSTTSSAWYQPSSATTLAASAPSSHLGPGWTAGIVIIIAAILFKLGYMVFYGRARRRKRREMNEKMSALILAKREAAELASVDRFEIFGPGRFELPQPMKPTELHAVNVCELEAASLGSEPSDDLTRRWERVCPYAGDVANR